MAKATWINIGGTWRKVKNVWINMGGIWKQNSIIKGNINGTWKDFIQYVEQIIQTINLDESMNRSRSYSLSVNNLISVDSISIDTGKVDYKINGNVIDITISGGDSSRSQYDSTKYSKYKEEYRESSSNSFSNSISVSDGSYSGNITKSGSSYVSSGEFIPADRKYVDNQYYSNYDKDGYKGTLEKYVASGSYTPADSKYVDNQYYCNYDKDGYKGTLEQYLASGSYTPADSKTVTKPWNGDYVWFYKFTSNSWVLTGNAWVVYPPNTCNYNESGYTGSLSISDFHIPSAPIPSGSGTEGQTTSMNAIITIVYSGTVTRPESDTRVWKYRGTVTRPESDTRVWKYRGTVNKPASDTRVWKQKYTGYIYSGGYYYYYKYKINITYTKKKEN